VPHIVLNIARRDTIYETTNSLAQGIDNARVWESNRDEDRWADRTNGRRIEVEPKFRALLNVSHVAVTSATVDTLIRRRHCADARIHIYVASDDNYYRNA